jgi:hypothetical protein
MEARDAGRRSDADVVIRPFSRDAPERGGPRIRCPRCAWEPERASLWMCTCLHTWNTFDTKGKCPACGRQWRETCCLRCHQWSPHLDWYVDEDRS